MLFQLTLFLLASLASGQTDNAYEPNTKIPLELPQDEFLHFITRPDILVPKWNVTVYKPELLSPGYWFTAFYEQLGADASSKPYVGPQIYSDNGDLVWGSTDEFSNADTFDFRVAKMSGIDYLTLISLYARSALVLNSNFEIDKEVPIGVYGGAANMHDFNLVDDGKSALLLHRNITELPVDMSKTVGYNGHCSVSSHYIEELDTSKSDPRNWKSVFKWHVLDHISLTESNMARDNINKQCESNWDFFHANAIDKCPDGNLLLSSRNTDTIFKISKHDGQIMWRLGGSLSDFSSDFVFSRQHHARCHESNDTYTMISFLDNANGAFEHTNPFSRGLKVALDTEFMRASIIAEYPHPYSKIQGARGSCELLHNGNVLMGWSDRSLLSEYTADGEMLLSAEVLPKWVRTYRSYKFPFVGHPLDPPDVVSQLEFDAATPESAATVVYVSWNGATEVAWWHLYETDKHGESKKLIMSEPRTGFETKISWPGFIDYVVLEAHDEHDRILDHGTSRVMKTKVPKGVKPHQAMPADDQSVADYTALDKIDDLAMNDESAYQIDDSQPLGFDEAHPWLVQAQAVPTTAWGMFAAGALFSAIVLGVAWCIWRLFPRRVVWWRSTTYKPVADQESGQAEKPTDAFDMADREGSSSSLRDCSIDSHGKD